MLDSIKQAFALVFGNAAGALIAICGLAGVVVATVIDPIAAAVASAALLVALVAVLIFALRQRSLLTGPYRVLDETVTWEIAAADGSRVFRSIRQRVRFNYLVIAHVELASGDGDLFASFECNYGSSLKRFSRAGEEGILIELSPERTPHDGEVELTSRREIRDGFLGADEWVAHKASLPSRRTEFILTFPAGREVRNVRIIGPTGHGSRPAKNDELRSEGSRQVLRLKPRRYRANQSVKVTWSW